VRAVLLSVSAWLLLAAALWQTVVFLSIFFATHERDHWYFFSSDTVGFALMYEDLFHHGFHWSGWHIANHPEYPEMAWYFAVRALVGQVAEAQVLSALLQPILLAAALWLLCRAIGGACARGAAVIGPLGALLVVLLFNTGHAFVLIGFLWSMRRASTMILVVASLAGLLKGLTRPTAATWVALVTLVAVGAASDMIYLAAFVAPALGTVAGALLARGIRGTRLLLAATGLVVGAALGLAGFRLADPMVNVARTVGFTPSDTLASLRRLIVDLVRGPEHVVYALIVLAWLALLAAIVWRRGRPSRLADPLALGALFGLLMVLAQVGALVVTRKPLLGGSYLRYLSPVYAAAVVGLALVLWGAAVRLLGGSTLRASAIASIVAAVALVATWRTLPAGTRLATDYYPPVVRCLDSLAQAHDLQYGIADYWLAKLVTATSRQGLRIYPVYENLVPFTQYANIEWFLGGVGARRHDHPGYTFAILGSPLRGQRGITRQTLARWGPPRAIETCAGYDVVILNDLAGAKSRKRFRRHPAIRSYYRRHGYALP